MMLQSCKRIRATSPSERPSIQSAALLTVRQSVRPTHHDGRQVLSCVERYDINSIQCKATNVTQQHAFKFARAPSFLRSRVKKQLVEYILKEASSHIAKAQAPTSRLPTTTTTTDHQLDEACDGYNS